MFKWLGIGVLTIGVAAFGLAYIVTRIESYQNKENSEWNNQHANKATNPKVAVVVFSRSGNTGVLARYIASQENAVVFEIDAEDYELGIPGWINALQDARNNVAKIYPQKLDLSTYDKVYLGSPIWLYSPAPPIWQFVKNNSFRDKEVVLFNSFNSKFEQHFIDDFEALVTAQGALSFRHQYVKRGRMGDQVSTEKMLEDFDSNKLSSLKETKFN